MRRPVYLSTTLALALAAAGCNTPQGQNATSGALSGGANGAMIGASVAAGHPAGVLLGGVFGAAGGAMVASAATSNQVPGAAPNRPSPGAEGPTPGGDRPISVNPAVAAGDVDAAPRGNRFVRDEAEAAADSGRAAPTGPGGYGALARNDGAAPGYYDGPVRYGPLAGGYGPDPGYYNGPGAYGPPVGAYGPGPGYYAGPGGYRPAPGDLGPGQTDFGSRPNDYVRGPEFAGQLRQCAYFYYDNGGDPVCAR
jgi:hypothetical protein